MTVNIDELEVGFELTPLRKIMSADGMNAGVIDTTKKEGNAIHYDFEVARKAGLPGPVATGQTSTFYLNEMLTNLFGTDWLDGGLMRYKFIAPVYLSEVIIAKAKVTEKIKEESGTRLNLELWCERENGQRTTVGDCTLVVR